jgi:hypothetical protein
VLWANRLLEGGAVHSDESDKWALYKHVDKLDKLAADAKLESFSSLLDHTDIQYNMGDDELPDGMKSTNDLMAVNGVWRPADEALTILQGLLTAITSEKPRFGVLKYNYEAVVAELSESLEYALRSRELGAKFNFSIVM